MPAWIVIARANLDTYVVGVQAAALDAVALSTGQTSRFEEIMPRVASKIRSKCQAKIGNQISATPNAIPPELVECACRLIIEGIQVGMRIEMTADQVRMADAARKDLDDVVSGKLPISIPDDPLTPTPVQFGGVIKLITHSRPEFNRDTLRNL